MKSSILAALLCLLGTAAAATAQTPQAPPPSSAAVAPVLFGTDTLLWIRAPLGPYSPAERAAAIGARLRELGRDGFADVDSVGLRVRDAGTDILLGSQVVMTVTDADAAAARLTRGALAASYAALIEDAIEERAVTHDWDDLAFAFLYAVLATVVLVLLLRGIRRLFPAVYKRLRRWQGSTIPSLHVQNLELISAERIVDLLTGVLKAVRLLVTLLLLYAYVLLVFGFFPWTRDVADALAAYILAPVERVADAIVGYMPDLFSILVIVVVTYYILKLIRLVFHGIENGAIEVAGFYRDWAQPTYKIVRFLVLIFALILVWPHLPNSDSTAFKGVAAFVGLLLSLGSASAISNIVGGVVMVYMRPFQVGDRVRIADTVGDVLEKTLLVTRIRTIKNVEITIPNSMVLGSHIINYSIGAGQSGLILHTTVTIGYDVPWREVHKLLIAAATATEGILAEPAPFVLQTALNDFYVSYEVNAYTDQPNRMAAIYSVLHQNIQDRFNEAGVEILSPHYRAQRDGSPTTIPALE